MLCIAIINRLVIVRLIISQQTKSGDWLSDFRQLLKRDLKGVYGQLSLSIHITLITSPA
jgi:hypothetical protein